MTSMFNSVRSIKQGTFKYNQDTQLTPQEILNMTLSNGVVQIPCVASDALRAKSTAAGTLSAIFQKSAIWKEGSKGQITVTYGTNNCDGCSTGAAWSQVGVDSSKKTPSMNLGFIDPPLESFTFNGKTYNIEDFKDDTRNYCEVDSCNANWSPGATVIHEFCHALGMLHEHQNNLFKSNSIELDRAAVVAYYEGIGMSEQDAIVNVLNRYDCGSGECEYIGSAYDPESIMLYSLPDIWISRDYFKKFGNPTKPNFKLSDKDKEWLNKMYPSITNYPQLTISFVDKKLKPWKEAWIQKILSETLFQVVNIGFDFVSKVESLNKKYVPNVIYIQPSSNPPSQIENKDEPVQPVQPSVQSPVQGRSQSQVQSQTQSIVQQSIAPLPFNIDDIPLQTFQPIVKEQVSNSQTSNVNRFGITQNDTNFISPDNSVNYSNLSTVDMTDPNFEKNMLNKDSGSKTGNEVSLKDTVKDLAKLTENFTQRKKMSSYFTAFIIIFILLIIFMFIGYSNS